MSELAEDELYGLLAEWIALCVGLGPEMKVKPCDYYHTEIHHYFISLFEDCCFMMLELGLYKESKHNPSCYFNFAVPANKLAQTAVRNRKKGPSFQELAARFLELAGMHHGLLELETYKDFKVHPDRDRMFDLFAQLGYAQRSGPFCYYWTKKVDVLMKDDPRFWREEKSFVQKNLSGDKEGMKSLFFIDKPRPVDSPVRE